MSLTSNPASLYTNRTDEYIRYVERVRHRRGIQSILERLSGLDSAKRILDAGCGSGLSIRAIADATSARGVSYERIDGFDLTEAMLERCRAELRTMRHLELRRADVLRLTEQLPDSWTGYDLIVSASMLEYLSKNSLPDALSALRERLSPSGRIVVFITRRLYLPAQFSWRCEGYTRGELRNAFEKAGFLKVAGLRYPPAYWWLNVGNHVMMAENV